MSKVYMGQIMAECDCEHYGCETRGYCMAEKITQLEQKLSEVELRRVKWMNKSDEALEALTQSRAETAAAYERAAVECDRMANDVWASEAIRALATQEQSAALDAVKAEARAQGMREAAEIAYRYNVNRGQGSATARAITSAILAAIQKGEPK